MCMVKLAKIVVTPLVFRNFYFDYYRYRFGLGFRLGLGLGLAFLGFLYYKVSAHTERTPSPFHDLISLDQWPSF